MAELKEVFEMVTKQTEPELDSWKDQERRQRRAARNRKLGALVLAAALVSGIAAIAVLQNPSDEGKAPATQTAPTRPIGAQVVGLDGTVHQEIPGLPGDAIGLRPSPDGSTIAFLTYHQNEYRVGTIKIDGTDLRYLTNHPNNDDYGDGWFGVSWSPDGTQLAYSALSDIYVMDADGSNVRRLTTARKGDYHPSWSPDGSTIVYWHGSTSGVDGGPADSEIYLISASGGTPTRLTRNDVSDIEPTWSPDGEQIAYWNGGRIAVMRPDGSEDRVLFEGEGGGWAPTWSPDGSQIAFLSYQGHHGFIPLDDHTTVTRQAPLLEVRILDVATREVTEVPVRVATDTNVVSWLSNDLLLVNRYD
jgi:Tol biopolymer transport system component